MVSAKIEIVCFDAKDVIATSGPGISVDINENGTQLIWLDRQSVLNYNAFSGLDYDLYYDDEDLRDYYGYSGVLMKIPGTSIRLFSVADYSPPSDLPSIYNTMDAGDSAKYTLINNWLMANKK